jgi:outer membrane protein assembly factor BamA
MMVSLGGSFYDKTDSYDKEIISDAENFISSSFVKRDYRDYFDRRGANGFAAFRPFKYNTFKVSYTSDEYRPLYTKAHAAVFRRDDEFAPNPHNPALEDPFDRDRQNIYQICHDPDSGEKIEGLDRIIVKAVGASYELDTRDCAECPTEGLWARLDGEWAGRDFGGDLDYSRYLADLRFYNRFSPRQRFAIRIKAGGMAIPCEASCPCVPGPQDFFPKQFYVGGIGTMPGYDYKEFRGTHMVLMNLEYFVALKGNSGVVFFADGGDARGLGESTKDVLDAMKFKYDAGVAFRIESPGDHKLTIGVAKRLDDTDEPMLVTMRASRPF